MSRGAVPVLLTPEEIQALLAAAIAVLERSTGAGDPFARRLVLAARKLKLASEVSQGVYERMRLEAPEALRLLEAIEG